MNLQELAKHFFDKFCACDNHKWEDLSEDSYEKKFYLDIAGEILFLVQQEKVKKVNYAKT